MHSRRPLPLCEEQHRAVLGAVLPEFAKQVALVAQGCTELLHGLKVLKPAAAGRALGGGGPLEVRPAGWLDGRLRESGLLKPGAGSEGMPRCGGCKVRHGSTCCICSPAALPHNLSPS